MGEKSIGIVQSLDAVAALTDSTGGTAAATLASTVGTTQIALFIDLPTLADGDVVTTYTPGYKFKIVAVDFVTHAAVTTAAKASTLNLEIGTTNLTGGVVSLTSAACTPAGKEVAGTAVTAGNTGSATDTISVEAASTTTFVEGSGWVIITIQNMDTADAFASLTSKIAEILTAMKEHELMDS